MTTCIGCRLNEKLRQMGYPVLEALLLGADDMVEGAGGLQRLGDWFQAQDIHPATGHVVVKLARCSESIGVKVCAGMADAWHAALSLLAHPMVRPSNSLVVVEQSCRMTYIVTDPESRPAYPEPYTLYAHY